MLIQRLPQGLQQYLGEGRAGNDPSMQLRLFTSGVELATIDDELKGVMPDLEIVGVPPLKWRWTSTLLVFITHEHSPIATAYSAQWQRNRHTNPYGIHACHLIIGYLDSFSGAPRNDWVPV
jgi:hypothetical protein